MIIINKQNSCGDRVAEAVVAVEIFFSRYLI
jgi:hypothetical protein